MSFAVNRDLGTTDVCNWGARGPESDENSSVKCSTEDVYALKLFYTQDYTF